jgi:hypothetical protein
MNPEDDWFVTITQAPVERGLRNLYKTNAMKLMGNWLAGPSKVDLGAGAFIKVLAPSSSSSSAHQSPPVLMWRGSSARARTS